MDQKQYHFMRRSEDSYWWFIGKRLFVSELLSRFVKNRNNVILDIGCGTGGMSVFLQRWGTVLGIEPNAFARTSSKKRGIHVISGSINKIPVPGKTYSLVTVFDVLYHRGVREITAMHELHRVLVSNGIVILTDCAFEWLWSPHDDRMYARKRYSKQELIDLFESNRFTVLYASYLFFTPFPFFILNRLIQRYTLSSTDSLPCLPRPFNLLMICLMKFESLALRRICFPWGSSIAIIARKN